MRSTEKRSLWSQKERRSLGEYKVQRKTLNPKLHRLTHLLVATHSQHRLSNSASTDSRA